MADRSLTTVLFDLDGTLIDSIPLILASFHHTLEKFLGPAGVLDDATLIQGIGTPLRAQLGKYCDDPAVVEAMFHDYRAHNVAVHDALLRPFPAVNRAVEALRQDGFRLGVVTSKSREVAAHGLRLCGLEAHFEVLVALEDTAAHKPDPAPLHFGLARLGCEAREAVYVGDSTHDLRAGRAAGMRTGGVAWGPFPRADLLACEPTWFFETAEAMPGAFRAARGG